MNSNEEGVSWLLVSDCSTSALLSCIPFCFFFGRDMVLVAPGVAFARSLKSNLRRLRSCHFADIVVCLCV